MTLCVSSGRGTFIPRDGIFDRHVKFVHIIVRIETRTISKSVEVAGEREAGSPQSR